MSALSDEELVLLSAKRHVKKARRRISTLAAHLQRQRADGIIVPEAERLLEIMQDLLGTMIDHRRIVAMEVRLLLRAQYKRTHSQRGDD
ncbi:hypothetical protein [Burkholderia orbicola]|uniref:hypothetical protein n=1 Tax=Burkholderia orbicola TaxID=2978683 RepID=UPI002657039A|nr:hypothetical protein [Burkholderia orbicola]MDN7559100.1 hypothetical protein [Burkholderia orbicola]